MADRDCRQPLVLHLAKHPIGTLTELFYGRAAGRLVTLVHGRQQLNVLSGVAGDKARHGALAALQLSGIAVLGDQSGYLLAGIAAHLHQVADHHPLVRAGRGQVAESDQLPLYPAVAGILVSQDRKGYRLGARQEIPKLVCGGQIVELHDGLHPPS